MVPDPHVKLRQELYLYRYGGGGIGSRRIEFGGRARPFGAAAITGGILGFLYVIGNLPREESVAGVVGDEKTRITLCITYTWVPTTAHNRSRSRRLGPVLLPGAVLRSAGAQVSDRGPDRIRGRCQLLRLRGE